MQEIRAAIIGVSGYGTTHYYALLEQMALGTMRPVAATIVNQDEEEVKTRSLRALGAEVFDSHHEMLDAFKNRIDLCFIPTGIPFHAPMTIDALRAGANVYVEKPVAATIQQARAMQEEADKAGRFVVVGYQQMFAPETLETKRRLRDALGEIRLIKSAGGGTRAEEYYRRNSWAGKLKVGDQWVLDSPFNNASAHALNLICFLAGTGERQPAGIKSVQAELYRAHDIESADTACLRITTTQGAVIYFTVTHCTEGKGPGGLEIRGDKGVVHWDSDRATFATLEGETSALDLPWPGKVKYTHIMDRVLSRFKDDREFVCGPLTASAQTLCTNGAHESSPVHAIPQEFVSRAPYKTGTKRMIQGIDQAIQEGYEQEKLFSELGIPWAKPGTVVDMEGYEFFPGGKKPPS